MDGKNTVSGGGKIYPREAIGEPAETQERVPIPHPVRDGSAAVGDAGAKPQKDGDPVSKSTTREPQGADLRAIFDERSELFIGPLGAACDAVGVKTAVAVVIDPAFPTNPIVFVRGGEYDAAKLLASLLRQLQQHVLEEMTP